MNKRYVETMIRLLESIEPGQVITNEEGRELCNGYWEDIRNELGKKVFILCTDSVIVLSVDYHLTATLKDYREKLAVIEKAEQDRELDNKAKQTSIKYAKKANRNSKIAIVISVVAIILEILLRIL